MKKATPSEAKWLCRDDPVRPELRGQFRSTKHREMYYTGETEVGKVKAVICTAFVNKIPTTVDELLKSSEGKIAVLYSVWSYKMVPKAGRDIVFEVLNMCKERGCTKFVTMSPKTPKARRFHENNGAVCIAENEETDNFEYKDWEI